MGQPFIYSIRTVFVFFAVDQYLLYDTFNESIFGLYDLFFIAFIYNICCFNRMFQPYILIIFKEFNGMPPNRRMGWIMGFHHDRQFSYFIFNLITVMKNIRFGSLFIVMNCCMEENIKSFSLGGRYRDNRNVPQHFRKTMQVNLHSSLFHDIHHVQCKHNRLSQFQKLQCKV